MKGAFVVVQPSVHLLSDLAEVAGDLGLDVRRFGGSVQVSAGDGRLFTMFADAEPDWEWRQATPVGFVEPVTLDCLAGFAVECRWEDMFCEVVGALGPRVGALWVVDGDGVLWPAGLLDPSRIRL